MLVQPGDLARLGPGPPGGGRSIRKVTAALSTPVRMTLPARAEYVAVARGVLLVASGRAGLTIDAGDDLALAVDEMCAALLGAEAAGELSLVVETPPGRIVVQVSGVVGAAWPPPDWEDSTPALILEALVDAVAFGSDGDRASITVEKVPDAAG